LTDYALSVLRVDHDLSGFDCGAEGLTAWLRGAARHEQAAGTSQTYVWTEVGQLGVLAYFTIAPWLVAVEGLSRHASKGTAAGGALPAFLLGKLALDRQLRGQTPRLGPNLLVDALVKIVQAADLAGGRVIIVDTLDDAAFSFYKRADFAQVGKTSRLHMRLATARAGVRD
jgi:hypothetical protein